MISCTEFIAAYSELFKYLEYKGGKEAVEAYWQHISKEGVNELHDEVSANGLRGCWNYWTRTLNEEAADFIMTIDDERGVFSIDMRYCPSKGRLLEQGHIKPYQDYCRHCDALYRGPLESLGYIFDIDLSECDAGRCRLTVANKQKTY